MSLTLKWTIPNVQEVCQTFSCLKVYRSASLDGPFSEISAPDTRPELIPSVTSYRFTDPSGSETLAYASSYYSPSTLRESSLSKPQLGTGDPALELLPISRLKQDYLFGLKMQDHMGRPLPDSVFATGIRTALAWVQRKLGFRLLPTTVVGEQHDFRPDSLRDYCVTYANVLPVQSLQSLSITWPLQSGPSQTLAGPQMTFHKWDGAIQVSPGVRFGSLLGGLQPGAAAAAYPLAYGFIGNANYLPNALRLSYTAGFPPGEVPADLLDLVAKAACLQPLAVAGDLIGPPGVSSSSIGLDGLSQSVGRIASQSGNAYASRANAYQAQLAQDLRSLKAHYLGIPIRIV